MTSDQIRELHERMTRLLSSKPSAARARGTCNAELADGFACAVSFGDHRLTFDLPEGEGGANTGPTPGQVMRSGLAACLAIGYRLWGIRLGTLLDEVAIIFTCELDARGQLGVEGVPPGWQKLSWTVRVKSDAAEADILRVLDTAERVSPMLSSLDREIVRERTVEITRTS